MIKRIGILLILSGLLASCKDPAIVEESKVDMPEYWAQKNRIDFPFEITDAKASYKLFYTIRYNNDYPYYNLWVNRTIIDENGYAVSKKMQGMNLFQSASGEPYGAGFGNYFDYKILSDSTHKFYKPGKYTIRIEQNMRIDTLNGIASVGIEVVKNAK